ncbi:MAG: hypothetical protein R3C61_19175 [Bacteroidia bacterium]
MQKILFISLLTGLFLSLKAQDTDSLHQSSLAVIGKSYGDSIVLRWAPVSAGLWAISNQQGYTIERLSYMRPEDFDPELYRKLTPQPLKPWPLEQWATIGRPEKNNPMAAVAAQCIYGKNLSIGKKDAGYFQQAGEMDNRWTLTLLAADISPATAAAAGLRFADRDIDPMRTYVYRIYPAVSPEIYPRDTAYIVINAGEKAAIPLPVIASAVEMENQIHIEWSREEHTPYFTAFYIERSEDRGKTYRRLTDLPFVSPPSQDSALYSPHMVYSDSIEENYRPYFYRIVGITPFGEPSEPSEPIMAMGRDRTPPPAPRNLKATYLGGSQVKITWEMPDVPGDMEGFYVGRSDNALSGFQPLHTQALSPSVRFFTDTNADPLKANFYVVASKDTAGNGQVSMAVYGIIVDSLPPAQPRGLTGKVDSSGRVTLRWNLGKEKDIIGYEVFFANAEDHVFARITDSPWRDTVYYDTIMVKTLTEHAFYRIVAVDANYNYSPFSAVLKLKRPDQIPPTPPVFSNYEVGNGFIRVEWIPSSSEDVAMHLLFRRETGGEWEQIALFPGKNMPTAYTDSMISPGTHYEYSIMAIDDDGLSSEEAYPLFLKAVDFSLKPPVKALHANLNSREKQVEITWQYPYSGQFRYTVYRAVNGGNFVSLGNNKSEIKTFTDRQIRAGHTYEYAVKVIYANGSTSGFSPQVKLKVE